ncbi:MAG: hypothetical protein ACO3JL_10860 [Myxococcota bacterium]
MHGDESAQTEEKQPWASPVLSPSLESSVMERLSTDRRYFGHPRRDWLIFFGAMAAFAVVLRLLVAALRSQLM